MILQEPSLPEPPHCSYAGAHACVHASHAAHVHVLCECTTGDISWVCRDTAHMRACTGHDHTPQGSWGPRVVGATEPALNGTRWGVSVGLSTFHLTALPPHRSSLRPWGHLNQLQL